MANILDRLIFVKDPSALPVDVPHEDAIEALSRDYKLVILFSHGDDYDLPDNWIFPSNVKLIAYSLDNASIQATVIRLRDLLQSVGVKFESRHLGLEALPIPLSGALIHMNTDTTLVCLNSTADYFKHVKTNETKQTIQLKTDWDL